MLEGSLYNPEHKEPCNSLEIGSVENIPAFIEEVKAKKRRLMGFGHRVYKSYDPRAKILKKIAYDVFQIMGRDELIDVAVELERIALSDGLHSVLNNALIPQNTSSRETSTQTLTFIQA